MAEKKELKEPETEVSENEVKETEEVVTKEPPVGEVSQEDSWIPKTQLGKDVKEGRITDINDILDKGLKILEDKVVDTLIPDIEKDLINIGQSKGKFGGGKRSIWKQTQKKTSEGNKPKFSIMAVVGNNDGIVGVGFGKAKETVPAREKALRKAKISIMKIKRGAGSWQDIGQGLNSIPFAVEGKCGSVKVRFMPAPRGTGLSAEKECRKILKLAGIKDIYSQTSGQTKSKINLVKATMAALRNLTTMKVHTDIAKVQNE